MVAEEINLGRSRRGLQERLKELGFFSLEKAKLHLGRAENLHGLQGVREKTAPFFSELRRTTDYSRRLEQGNFLPARRKKSPSQLEAPSTGTGCPESSSSLHPWRLLSLDWTSPEQHGAALKPARWERAARCDALRRSLPTSSAVPFKASAGSRRGSQRKKKN